VQKRLFIFISVTSSTGYRKITRTVCASATTKKTIQLIHNSLRVCYAQTGLIPICVDPGVKSTY